MTSLSSASQAVLYILLVLLGLLSLIVLGWQIQVLRGKEMKNTADGTVDSWHEQKILYGMAVADIFLACPLCLIGIALVFISPRWGFYLLAWVSFWFAWTNIMTTATSLRFEKPKITLSWLIFFPFGSLVGFAYFVWTLFHFDAIFQL